jgi:hypothetical protein
MHPPGDTLNKKTGVLRNLLYPNSDFWAHWPQEFLHYVDTAVSKMACGPLSLSQLAWYFLKLPARDPAHFPFLFLYFMLGRGAA